MPNKRGLYCTCGAELSSRMVAESYPIEGGGHRRRRVCGKCHGDAVSIEWILGVKAGPMLLITGLEDKRSRGSQRGPTPHVSAVRALVESLGGTVTRL